MRVVHIVGLANSKLNATIVALLQSQGCVTRIVPIKEPEKKQKGTKSKTHICKFCQAETTQPDADCYANPSANQKTDLIKN